jgi:hypothetical protein
MAGIQRDAIARAELFIDLAKRCSAAERNLHEAYMEAAIVFARTAIHRIKSQYERRPGWKQWWDSLLNNASIVFIRAERDWILKNDAPKVGQVIRLCGEQPLASDFYYYEDINTPAIDTVGRHIRETARLVQEADHRFQSTATGAE